MSDESEQLEKSCLTDEHEHEQHHQVGYLSDGSQNSNKRRREVKGLCFFFYLNNIDVDSCTGSRVLKLATFSRM